MSMHWFAIHSQAQKESLAARELHRLGFEVFWPHTTAWVGTGHKAKSRLVKRSWLSRYLFVRTAKDNLGEVGRSPGVASVVHAPGGEAYPIPESIMEALLSKADHLGEVYIGAAKRVRNYFKKGQVIRLLDEKSPLFGFYVEVIKTLDNGTVMCTLESNAIAGTGKTILTAPVIGEVVERTA